MTAPYTISFDTSELTQVAKKLEGLDKRALAKLRTEAVKNVSLSVREQALDYATTELNVTRAYAQEKIDKVEQLEGSAFSKAVIRSKYQGTTLQRFGAKVRTAPVRFTNADVLRIAWKSGFVDGKVIGPRAPLRGKNGGVRYSNVWTERRGDTLRGIQPNQKAAGVSVDVNRKGEKTISRAFMLPLRNDNGMGVFRWEGNELVHLKGPSVYQTFRSYIERNADAVADELRDDFLVRLDVALAEAV